MPKPKKGTWDFGFVYTAYLLACQPAVFECTALHYTGALMTLARRAVSDFVGWLID